MLPAACFFSPVLMCNLENARPELHFVLSSGLFCCTLTVALLQHPRILLRSSRCGKHVDTNIFKGCSQGGMAGTVPRGDIGVSIMPAHSNMHEPLCVSSIRLQTRSVPESLWIYAR